MSKSAADDLVAYIAMLREQGRLLTEDYNLSEVSGMAQLGAASKDDGKILILSITYEDEAYAAKITKAEGTIE